MLYRTDWKSMRDLGCCIILQTCIMCHERHVCKGLTLLSAPVTKARVERTGGGPWTLHCGCPLLCRTGLNGRDTFSGIIWLWNDNKGVLLPLIIHNISVQKYHCETDLLKLNQYCTYFSAFNTSMFLHPDLQVFPSVEGQRTSKFRHFYFQQSFILRIARRENVTFSFTCSSHRVPHLLWAQWNVRKPRLISIFHRLWWEFELTRRDRQ